MFNWMRALTGEIDGGVLQTRPLEHEDLEELCGFVDTREELFFSFPAVPWPLTPGKLWDVARRRTDPSVFLHKGAPVAYANFYDCRPGESCAVGNIMVSPKRRRKGIGKGVLTYMTHRAFTKHRAKFVKIACFSENIPALRLYKKLGFTPFDMDERLRPGGRHAILVHLGIKDVDFL